MAAPIAPLLADSQDLEVDGIRFSARAWDVRTSTAVLARLLPALSPVVRKLGAEMANGARPSVDSAAFSGAALEAIAEILPAVSPELLEYLTNQCAAACSVDLGVDATGRRMEPELGAPGVLDQVFRRKPLRLIKWIAAVLRFQLGDFSGGLIGGARPAQ